MSAAQGELAKANRAIAKANAVVEHADAFEGCKLRMLHRELDRREQCPGGLRRILRGMQLVDQATDAAHVFRSLEWGVSVRLPTL